MGIPYRSIHDMMRLPTIRCCRSLHLIRKPTVALQLQLLRADRFRHGGDCAEAIAPSCGSQLPMRWLTAHQLQPLQLNYLPRYLMEG